MFFTNWVGADVANPDRQRLDRRPRQERRLVRLGGRRQDRGAEATSSRAPSSPDEQKKIAAEIQKEAYDQVIYIPLGQYLAPSAWRKSLTGVLDGPATPVFWNIDKSE